MKLHGGGVGASTLSAVTSAISDTIFGPPPDPFDPEKAYEQAMEAVKEEMAKLKKQQAASAEKDRQRAELEAKLKADARAWVELGKDIDAAKKLLAERPPRPPAGPMPDVSKGIATKKAGSRRRRTYRKSLKGGDVQSVKTILGNAKITETAGDRSALVMRNPDSKFVVATYWWGEANVNKNLQEPCPEDITAEAKKEVVKAYIDRIPKSLVTIAKVLGDLEKESSLTKAKSEWLHLARRTWSQWETALFADPDVKKKLADKVAELWNAKKAEAGTTNIRRNDRKFPEMIAEWQTYCENAKVNSIALQTEFPRTDYQHGINAKPLFIIKLLDYLRESGKGHMGVLYIDGDMWVHSYPKIFDIEDVDFMARSWNIDIRAKKGAKPYYDPMIFETSGGTMYFGNTEAARRLLRKWSEMSEAQPGKADDRVLSQVFTTHSMVLGTNVIGLPIEYLWLTDMYKEFLPYKLDTKKQKEIAKTFLDAANAAKGGAGEEQRVGPPIIEHPYCLTGEERAADQGASANRTPAMYDEEIVDAINYKRPSELIYEYIMFNGNKEMRDEMGEYLTHIGETVGEFSKVKLAEIVPFDKKYGQYQAVADENLKDLPDQAKPTGTTSSVTTGSIKDILKELRSGNNVWTGPGEPPTFENADIQCYGMDGSGKSDGADPYTRFVQLDVTKPIFFSATSPVLQHLLAMCADLPSINTHLKNSYLFMSRIRWELAKPETVEDAVEAPAPVEGGPSMLCAAEMPRIVHQVWFGNVDPGWRETLFRKNKEVCEAHGYKYRLWRETDRLEKKANGKPLHFPITFSYQETARSKGNTRWAQVADLARLELLYNNGGIYADSIIEISPALLMAVEDAVKKGKRFIGCNEDPCDPFGTGEGSCEENGKPSYLTNSFFAATRENPLFERLLDWENVLDKIDFDSDQINETTGPYLLRTMIRDPGADGIFLLKSDQVFQYNQQPTTSKPVTPDPFITREPVAVGKSVDDLLAGTAGGAKLNVVAPYGTVPAVAAAPAVAAPSTVPEAEAALNTVAEVATAVVSGTCPTVVQAISIKVKDGQHFTPGGIDALQRKFLSRPAGTVLTNADYAEIVEKKGPVAIYHSGLGGTWST